MARMQLVYPKMPGSSAAPFANCVAFEKYDGTNLHWVWERELGWYAFGTRRDRFDLDPKGIAEFCAAHTELAEAPAIFLKEWQKELSEILETNDDFESQEITAFTEFLGAHSFAGRHQKEDAKRLVLFDVQTSCGFLHPEKFVACFSSMPTARVVYRGKLTGRFADDVREGRYNVAEGVICKGGEGASVWMVKIKTHEYMQRLQQAFANDWEIFWE